MRVSVSESTRIHLNVRVEGAQRHGIDSFMNYWLHAERSSLLETMVYDAREFVVSRA